MDNMPDKKYQLLNKSETHSQSWECVFDCSRAVIDSSLEKKAQILSILVQSDEIISFETFIFNSNNFFLYFSDWFVWKIKRETNYFKTFLESEQWRKLDAYLTSKVKNLSDSEKRLLLYGIPCDENVNLVKNSDDFLKFLHTLYQAYLEFKKLWVSNWELLWFNA